MIKVEIVTPKGLHFSKEVNSVNIPKILNTLMYLFSVVASLSFAIYGLQLLLTDFSFTISFKASSIFDFSFGGDALSGFSYYLYLFSQFLCRFTQ